ncbi:hypothetical protein C8R44DRAFT_811326 [Mycena epipterygia]|nr:hypothetical protein C8R44DRAFT_811326 [Mycena epipterygia]
MVARSVSSLGLAAMHIPPSDRRHHVPGPRQPTAPRSTVTRGPIAAPAPPSRPPAPVRAPPRSASAASTFSPAPSQQRKASTKALRERENSNSLSHPEPALDPKQRAKRDRLLVVHGNPAGPTRAETWAASMYTAGQILIDRTLIHNNVRSPSPRRIGPKCRASDGRRGRMARIRLGEFSVGRASCEHCRHILSHTTCLYFILCNTSLVFTLYLYHISHTIPVSHTITYYSVSVNFSNREPVNEAHAVIGRGETSQNERCGAKGKRLSRRSSISTRALQTSHSSRSRGQLSKNDLESVSASYDHGYSGPSVLLLMLGMTPQLQFGVIAQLGAQQTEDRITASTIRRK